MPQKGRSNYRVFFLTEGVLTDIQKMRATAVQIEGSTTVVIVKHICSKICLIDGYNSNGTLAGRRTRDARICKLAKRSSFSKKLESHTTAGIRC